MRKFFICFLLLASTVQSKAQVSYPVTFTHDGKTVYGTFATPASTGKYATIIINPGSGPNDRDGTFPMIGANIECLYPALLNDTLRPYKELSDALVAAGYAVLRYDKLEYTYSTPALLGPITFHKLWLPVESAIQYAKTRADVDTNKIMLIGHSEGSTMIPIIAHGRSDVKALISIAGARTPIDSLLAMQIVNIARTCNGDTVLAKFQANQILSYYNGIRTNNWIGYPALFGVPASVWYDYIQATDSVSILYNLFNMPILFIGLELDINVPPVELMRFQEEVTTTDDFWSLPGLIHYMTPNDDPHVSSTLTDTIIHWLQEICPTSTADARAEDDLIRVYPNPFSDTFWVTIQKPEIQSAIFSITNGEGKRVFYKNEKHIVSPYTLSIDMNAYPAGVYFLESNLDGKLVTQQVIKE